MPGNPLSITLPTVGVTVGPAYATAINLALQTLITDVEAKVTPDEIAVNTDFSLSYLGTSYGLTDADRVELFEHSAVLVVGSALGAVYLYDNELYFQDGTGANVAITSGGSVAAAAGNIATTGSPAYGAGSNVIEWSGGDLEYRFLDDGTNDHAGLVFLDAQFRNGSNSMTMSSLVTTDYSVIWPAVAPTANLIQQVDSSGNVSFTNTIDELITASLGLTCAANQDITLSGTGELKHGSRVLQIPAPAWVGGDSSTYTAGAQCTGQLGGAVYAPICLDQGDRITNVNLYASQGAAGTLTAALYAVDDTGARTLIDSDTATGTGTNSMTMTGLTATLANGTNYIIAVTSSSGSTVTAGNTYITYDRP